MASKPPPATETLYVRLPRALKAEVQAYADDRGMKMATACSELLSRALDQTTNPATEAAIASLIACAAIDPKLPHPCLMDPIELAWRVSQITRQISEGVERVRTAEKLRTMRLDMPT